MKRLYKSSTDKKLDGVCAGVAEYLEVDPTLIRLIYVLLTMFTAVIPGLFAYIILALIIPRESEVKK